jgi:hypothetical protein
MLPQSKTKNKAAPSSTILRRDLNGSPFQEKWDYRRIIGKLNFLEKSTRPDIAYVVRQCARFASNPGSPILMPSSTSAGIYLA